MNTVRSFDPDEVEVNPKALIGALEECQQVIAHVDAQVGGVTDVESLWQLLEMVRELRGKELLATLEDNLVNQLHGAIPGYRYELPDGRRIVKGATKESERWDGKALISKVAAHLADEITVDPETGEFIPMPPPGVITERVASFVGECLGGMAPSTKWRLSPLRAIGIDPDKYRTYERGRATVREER